LTLAKSAAWVTAKPPVGMYEVAKVLASICAPGMYILVLSVFYSARGEVSEVTKKMLM
jgi:hypothetical protein